MRIFLILGLLLALICTVHADDASKCKKKYPHLYNLITGYCVGPNKAGFASPGIWAETGGKQKGRQIGVRSGALGYGGSDRRRGPACSPVSFIPVYWCRSQFYNMCVSKEYNGHDLMTRNYGNNGCQNFWFL